MNGIEEQRNDGTSVELPNRTGNEGGSGERRIRIGDMVSNDRRAARAGKARKREEETGEERNEEEEAEKWKWRVALPNKYRMPPDVAVKPAAAPPLLPSFAFPHGFSRTEQVHSAQWILSRRAHGLISVSRHVSPCTPVILGRLPSLCLYMIRGVTIHLLHAGLEMFS